MTYLRATYNIAVWMHGSTTIAEIYLKFPDDYLKGIFQSDVKDDQVVISKADLERFRELEKRVVAADA